VPLGKMMEAQKGVVKVEEHLPSEDFTETEMLELWYKFADRLGDKGAKIMESLLRISDPKLDGTIIIYELPNEGSKIDFEKRMIGIDQNFINLEKSLHRSILFVISSLLALMTILKFIKT
jgi:hypothetical protein